MIPIYIFYSMFGFQRTGDALWAAADQMARGFLIGATAGRTTLTGEGLQHADGHSPLLAVDQPRGRRLRPGLRLRDRAHRPGRPAPDVRRRRPRTSSTTSPSTTSRYVQPAEPEDVDVEGILRGMYLLAPAGRAAGRRAPAGPAAGLRRRACRGRWRRSSCCASDWGVAADVWSSPPGSSCAATALACDEHAFLHPGEEPRVPYVTQRAGRRARARSWRSATTCARSRTRSGSGSRRTSRSLGTDGFGFSDTRPAARRYFPVDGPSVATCVLQQLARARRGPGRTSRPRRSSKYRLPTCRPAPPAPPAATPSRSAGQRPAAQRREKGHSRDGRSDRTSITDGRAPAWIRR